MADHSHKAPHRHSAVSRKIKQYYDQQLSSLSITKQFHYLSRVALLLDDQTAWKQLRAIRDAWLPQVSTLQQQIESIPTASPEPIKSGKTYRLPYHERHPNVARYNRVFFKMLFLETVYGESIDTLTGAVDQADLAAAAAALQADPEAVFALSTVAINFLYHVAAFFPSLATVDPSALRGLAHQYQRQFPWGQDAAIYLYTHAIIGASRFYAQPITANQDVYVALLKELDAIVQTHYPEINLDQKCEIIVCGRLLETPVDFYAAALKEAQRSFSPSGDYLVDTLNIHHQAVPGFKETLAGSEHRNVLALVAFNDEG